MIKDLEQLPFTIEMAGIVITIAEDNKIQYGGEGIPAGVSHYGKQQIFLRTKDIELDLINHALYHEMFHWMLYLQGYYEINNDEEFVDRIALLMHDTMKSFR